MRDSLGVPLEPKTLPHVHIGYDWLGRDIYSDDNNDYIDLEGDLILDEPDEIRAYVMQHAVIKTTMQLYEEVTESDT